MTTLCKCIYQTIKCHLSVPVSVRLDNYTELSYYNIFAIVKSYFSL